MGGALRRLEAPPHEVATFSVDLWPWERDSDHHQSSSGNGANQQEFHKSPTEPLDEYKNVDAVNDLGCFIALPNLQNLLSIYVLILSPSLDEV